jgi:methyltransferase
VNGVVVIAVLAVVFTTMAMEAVRAARNERRQRARGGVEPDGDVYAIMRVAYPMTFLVLGLEGAARGWAAAAPAGLPAGVFVFTLAKALKWWAIATLGECWTFRVIVVPGSRRVGRGPYRWLAHPNYVGVIGELLGAALMLGAAIAGPLVALGFGVLIWLRLRVERRALTRLY